jgi:hypothetical protein
VKPRKLLLVATPAAALTDPDTETMVVTGEELPRGDDREAALAWLLVRNGIESVAVSDDTLDAGLLSRLGGALGLRIERR